MVHAISLSSSVAPLRFAPTLPPLYLHFAFTPPYTASSTVFSAVMRLSPHDSIDRCRRHSELSHGNGDMLVQEMA